ncbi:MAG: endolytic transglycosylase MltG [Candidatus Saccharibacteria bacterium]
MKYSAQHSKHRWPRRLTIVLAIVVVLVVGATIVVRQAYYEKLKPVSTSQHTQLVTVAAGASLDQIANQLQQDGLIRSAWAFKLYVSSKQVRADLQAGTYAFAPSQTVAQIVSQLTHGKIATNQVTILPGQRIDQIQTSLVNDGFKESEVKLALDPAQYVDNPALVDKPAGASLEGYLYPDTFQKDANTTPQEIVTQSLTSMDQKLTPDLRSAFAKQGLSTYQGIVLASMVEQEANNATDRQQVAQVFLSRLHQNMTLGSDVTAFYGATLAGKPRSTTYDSAYNTLIYKGLPPTPISNVSEESLQAVAHPATTDWLFFVAGDDGVVHFSKTLADHDALIQQYCHKLCGQ